MEVTVAPIPEPEFVATVERCAGSEDGRIQVTSPGSQEWVYSIDGGHFISKSELELQNLTPGIYEIQTKSSFGCLAELVVVEILGTDPLDLQMVEAKDAACGINDGFIRVSMTGGWPSYTLTLTDQTTGAGQTITTSDLEHTFENLRSGVYTLEVIDSEGCTLSLGSPVTILDGPTEIIIENLVEICEGELVSLNPSINPLANDKTFRWYKNTVSTGSEITDGLTEGNITYQLQSNGNLTISGLTAGNDSPTSYLVLVEGPAICEGDVETVEVNIYPEPQFTATVENVACFGEGGAILLNPIISASNIMFSINGGDFTAYPDNKISGLSPGSYTLAAQHASGCLYNLPGALTIEGPGSGLKFTSIDVVDASCLAANGLIAGVLEGGWAPYTVSVLGSNGFTSQLVIPVANEPFEISGLGVGTYSLTVIDNEGCEIVSEQQTIVDSPTPILVDDVEICIGEQASLQPSIPNSNLSPTFTWYYDAAGLEPIASSQVNGVVYQISGNGEMIVTGLPTAGSPYIFYVSVEGEGICPGGLEEVTVTVNSMPFLRTSNPSIICDPTETVDLTRFIDGFDADIYDYFVVNPSGQNMRLDEMKTVSVSGTYNVQMSYKGSPCLSPSERILVVIAETELVASFDYQVDIGNGDLILNEEVNIGEVTEFLDTSLGDAILWNWDFGDGNFSSEQNPEHIFENKGSYVIKLTTLDKNGCESEFQRVIEVLDDFRVLVPNAFTPSRTDGKNNLFEPKFRGLSKLELFVFNTWGNLIYSSDSMENIGWDGKFNGKDSPNGNYVYKVNYTSRGGEEGTQTGVFILIR